MRELMEHPIYKLLKKDEYYFLCPDYVVYELDELYEGVDTHKKAIINTIELFNKRPEVQNYMENSHPVYTIDISKMECEKYDNVKFFATESNVDINYVENDGHILGQMIIPDYITYYYAVSEHPYGIFCGEKDFEEINDVLFPKEDRAVMEVYIWNNEFSNYFDDGKEWWGTGMWSVYNPRNSTMVVIGASVTD